MVMPRLIWCRLELHEIVHARSLALASAGNNMAARIAMMAMTTSNSIKVKARTLLLFWDKTTMPQQTENPTGRFQFLFSPWNKNKPERSQKFNFKSSCCQQRWNLLEPADTDMATRVRKIHSSSVGAAGETPQCIGAGFIHFNHPVREFHQPGRAIKSGEDGDFSVPRTGVLVGTACAVVEPRLVVQLRVVGALPKGDASRGQLRQFRRRIQPPAVTADRAVHHVAGNLLPPHLKQCAVRVVARTEIHFLIHQHRPEAPGIGLEFRRAAGGGVEGVQ